MKIFFTLNLSNIDSEDKIYSLLIELLTFRRQRWEQWGNYDSLTIIVCIKQLLSTGIISIDYVKLKDNLVDPLNWKLIEKMLKGMRPRPLANKFCEEHPKLVY